MLLSGLLGNLGAVTQSPLAKAATRYWWVTIPLAYVAWSAYKKQKVKGHVDWHSLVGDVAPATTIALSIITLDLMLQQASRTTVSGLAGGAPSAVHAASTRLAPAKPVISDAVFSPATPQMTTTSEDPHGL